MTNSNENVYEFLKDQYLVTASLSQKKHINKMERLAAQRPDECTITERNKDGSIVAKFPVSWLRVAPPKEVSETQREAARHNMQNLLSSRRNSAQI